MCDSDVKTVSATEPDWTREQVRGWWDPSRQLLRTIRRYQKCESKPGSFNALRRKWHVFWYRFWSVVTGAEIGLTTRIGGGLLIPHPNGIVIHSGAVIGPNCLLFQQVTLGSRERDTGAPVIGGHVDIGARAKLLGSIRVGDHARIGANAVVLCDVPTGVTAVGVVKQGSYS